MIRFNNISYRMSSPKVIDTAYNFSDSSSPMTYGEKIRAERERRAMSQAELAQAVGISQPAIKKIEAGQTQRSRYLSDVLRYLGIQSEESRSRPAIDNFDDAKMPVYSAVEGGPGEMVVSTDAIDSVSRPWYMRKVKDGYAVIVTGYSMIPAFEPGDMAIINPRSPLIRGKHAIFISGESMGEFRASIKRLDKETTHEWHVHQYNPPEGQASDLILPKRLWPRALRVVGKYEGG